MKPINLLTLIFGLSIYSLSAKAEASNHFEILDQSEKTLFALTKDGAKYKLVDGQGKLQATYKVKADKTKIFASDGSEIAKVKGDSAKLKVKDSRGTIFKMKLQADSGYKIKDANGDTLYKLKLKDYGYKIKNGEGQEIARLKKKGEKLKFVSSNRTTHNRGTKISPVLAALLNLDKVPLAIRVGMALRLSQQQ